MRLAYHGTPKTYFESLDRSQPYVPEPFAREGFIHTTEGREAVSITLTKYYKSSTEPWVVIYIDQDRVRSPIRYDDPAEVFPGATVLETHTFENEKGGGTVLKIQPP